MAMLRVIIFIFIIGIMILLFLPLQILSNILFLKTRFYLPKIFLKFINKIIGINVVINSTIKANRNDLGILYIANHVSWIDILCLGSILDANFIAKKEVSKMGIFGFLAKLNNTFFT